MGSHEGGGQLPRNHTRWTWTNGNSCTTHTVTASAPGVYFGAQPGTDQTRRLAPKTTTPYLVMIRLLTNVHHAHRTGLHLMFLSFFSSATSAVLFFAVWVWTSHRIGRVDGDACGSNNHAIAVMVCGAVIPWHDCCTHNEHKPSRATIRIGTWASKFRERGPVQMPDKNQSGAG